MNMNEKTCELLREETTKEIHNSQYIAQKHSAFNMTWLTFTLMNMWYTIGHSRCQASLLLYNSLLPYTREANKTMILIGSMMC